MASYRKVLLATDLSEFSSLLANKAMEIVNGFGAELNLLHVFELMPMLDPSYDEILAPDYDLAEQMQEIAEGKLEKLSSTLDVPKEKQYFETGSPSREIVRVAKEQNIDLIIIGTHGRHGLGILLGSTASSVVHHADCDVLTIRQKVV